ncbi:hypothetical protein BN961_04017 [Afipia felis]|uniref:Uncharacterized protein n=1 Tax=Afipia felis TaxID=1035 RepID=A0A090MVK9_AFIFE|nr:hypothetical protein BN961_04017 [Afipia felis]
MGEPEVTIDEREDLLGIKEFDAIVTAEMAALVVKPVRVADRMTFLGIDDERAIALSELTVRHDVDTAVADQPEAWFLTFAGLEAVIGIAEAAIGGGIGLTALDHRADGRDGEREHRHLPYAAIASGR